jgi:hypothetical protein
LSDDVAAATYRIGPSDFFTSGDLEADASTLNDQVTVLAAELEGNTSVPGDFLDAWHLFHLQWGKFYEDKFQAWDTFLVAFNDSNRDGLISFERQLAGWQQQAAAYDVAAPGPTIAPSTGSGDSIKNHLDGLPIPSTSSIVIIVVVAAVVLVIWKGGLL